MLIAVWLSVGFSGGLLALQVIPLPIKLCSHPFSQSLPSIMQPQWAPGALTAAPYRPAW